MNNRELVRTNCFGHMAAFGIAKANALADAAGESEGQAGSWRQHGFRANIVVPAPLPVHR